MRKICGTCHCSSILDNFGEDVLACTRNQKITSVFNTCDDFMETDAEGYKTALEHCLNLMEQGKVGMCP